MVATTPKPLTTGQRNVLDYLQRRQAEGDLPPTTREIQTALGIGSQTSVMQFLRALERKGAIRTMPGKARGVMPVEQPPRNPAGGNRQDGRSLFIDVPLYGDLDGGPSPEGLSPLADILPVHAPSMRLTGNSRPFALRVRGDDMIGACIQSGDYAVFDAACEPRPGDVVAARGNLTTYLRRLVMRGDRAFLSTENPRRTELHPLEEFHIKGVMVGLVRGANLL